MTISTADPGTLVRAAQDILSWTRPRVLSSEHVLSAGDERLGTLRFTGALARDATAECAGSRWQFHLGPPLRREVRILDAAERPVAVYRRRGLTGGRLEMANGDRFTWRSFGFWRRTWGFTRDEHPEPLVLFRLRFSFGHAVDEVTVDADGRRMPELPLLLLLGRFLTVRRRGRSPTA